MRETPIILCVDDEKIILECLKIQIQNHFKGECQIELAESGEEGLEIIDELRNEGNVRPHLIISDQIMPGMRGDQFLTEVHSKYPDIVKVMLTGMAQDEDIERAFEQADLRKVMHKPWSSEELLNTIEESLSYSQSENFNGSSLSRMTA
ncbi:response regulator [Ekhidna sp.]|uniref:response regulator n=1 Tax=Ekhidna sp. TaxID=2608089 RepID=UPI0035146018